MIKVLKTTKRFIKQCPECNNMLNYDYEDIETEGLNQDDEIFITCPVCNKKIFDIGY